MGMSFTKFHCRNGTERFSHIILFWLLLFSATEAAEPTLTATELYSAKDLLDAGRIKETLQVLNSYQPTSDNYNDVLFLKGLASLELAVRTSNEESSRELLTQAVEAFRTILNSDPSLIRVRLELGRAFFLQKKDRLVRREFERVLASNPPPVVQDNIRGILAVIKARRRWYGTLGVEVVRDSNFNRGTNNPTVSFFSLPFVRNDAVPKAAMGLVFTLRGGYHHPVTDTVDLVAGGGMERTEFPGSEGDGTVLDIYSGPEFQLNEHTRLSLHGLFVTSINSSVPNHTLGGRLGFIHRLNIRTSIGGHLTFGKRTFREDENTVYNAREFDTGVSLEHWLNPTLALELGISFARSNPRKAPDRKSRTVQLSAGASMLLRNGFTVGLSVSGSRKQYQGQPGFPTRDNQIRRDEYLTIRGKVLRRDFTIGGFSPQLVLVHERLSTNAQASDYRNNSLQVAMVRQF